MVVRNRKKSRSLKSACLPMAPVLLVRPQRRFRHVPLQGQLHSTPPDAPEKRVASPEGPIGIPPGGGDCGSEECPELARMRSLGQRRRRPITATDRKPPADRQNDAFDLFRT